MILERIPDLRSLSVLDQLTLMSELWENIASHPEEIPVSPAIIEELDRRLAHYHKHPNEVTTLDEIKSRLLATR